MWSKALLLVLLFSALGNAKAAASNAPVTIAVVLDPEGKFFHIQKPLYDGIRLFFADKKDVNLKLIAANEELDGQMAAAKAVVDQKINFVIGHNFSSSAEIFLRSLPQEHDLVYISPLATNSNLPTFHKGVFLTWPSNKSQAAAISKLIQKKVPSGGKVVAIVNISEPYPAEMSEILSKNLSQIGYQFESVSYLNGEAKLASKAADVLAKKPDVIFVPSYSFEMLQIYAALVPAIAKMTQKPLLLSGDTIGKEENFYEKLAGSKHDLGDNIYFTNGWHESIDTKENKDFKKRYRELTGSPATGAAAAGYEAASLLYAALKRSKIKNTQDVISNMKDLSIKLTVGTVAFQKDHFLSRPVVLMKATKEGYRHHAIQK